jgi:hypothetical protein
LAVTLKLTGEELLFFPVPESVIAAPGFNWMDLFPLVGIRTLNPPKLTATPSSLVWQEAIKSNSGQYFFKKWECKFRLLSSSSITIVFM